MGRDFRDYQTIQVISLILLSFSFVEVLRVDPAFNTMIVSLVNSMGYISIFMILNSLIYLALTPLAQSIWGDKYAAYKEFFGALVSVAALFFT